MGNKCFIQENIHLYHTEVIQIYIALHFFIHPFNKLIVQIYLVLNIAIPDQ